MGEKGGPQTVNYSRVGYLVHVDTKLAITACFSYVYKARLVKSLESKLLLIQHYFRSLSDTG
jgi:hypothetical protein